MFEEPQFAAGLSTRWISANAPPTSDTEHSTNDATAASKLASSAGRAIACPATTRTRTRGPVGASLGHHAQCVVGLDGHEIRRPCRGNGQSSARCRFEAWGEPGKGRLLPASLPLVRGHEVTTSPLPLKPIEPERPSWRRPASTLNALHQAVHR